MSSPTLWVVATPLGNLGDLSPRAREVLSSVPLVLAEDTRRATWLFNSLGLSRPRLLSLFEHNETGRISQIIQYLEQGQDIALISDAGTPLMADPGYLLVQACRDKGFNVSPVPGPCAPIAALMASGLPPYPFMFLGFLPRKPGDMRKLFTSLQNLRCTLVFFERKNRLQAALELAFDVFGQRDFCIARELTKTHEEFIRGTLGSLEIDFELLLGELTVVLAPGKEVIKTCSSQVKSLLEQHLSQGMKAKQAARIVTQQVSGWSSKEMYALCLEYKKQK